MPVDDVPDNDTEGDEDTLLPELDDAPEGDETPEGDDDLPPEGEEGSEGSAGAGGQARGADDEGDEPVSRRTRRVQKLERERDEERERANRLQASMDELRTSNRQPNPQDEAARRAEAERLAAMSPEERRAYDQDLTIRTLQHQMGNISHQIADATDKASFEAKSSINPLYKKYLPKVETALAGMRKNGANTTREALLTYMIGEDARKRLENKEGSEPRRRAARDRVERTQGRSNNNVRSDTGGNGRSDPNSLAALEKRLSGVSI